MNKTTFNEAINISLKTGISGHEKINLVVVPEYKMKVAAMSDALDKMEKDVEANLSKALWKEMAVTKKIPECITVYAEIFGDNAFTEDEEFATKHALSFENFDRLDEMVEIIATKISRNVALKVPYHIVHSKKFVEINS